MTHGTMPDTLLEVGGGPEQAGRGRTGLKIAAAAVVVALSAVGAYAVIGGGSPAADTSTTKTSAGKSSAGKPSTTTGKTPAEKAAAAKASADEMTANANGTPAKSNPAAKPAKPAVLPSAKNMTTAQKRVALIAYLKGGAFPLTADSSPATAAKSACTLLDGGMKMDKLITELSRGAGVTQAQGRFFLVGATHFYCAKYTVAP